MRKGVPFKHWDVGSDGLLHLYNTFGDPQCGGAYCDIDVKPTPERLKLAPTCPNCYRKNVWRHKG